MRFPLMVWRICFLERVRRSMVSSSPLSFLKVKRALPASTFPLVSRIPMAVLTVTDLPEPDSPTIATVSPRLTAKSTLRRAWTLPAVVAKETDRPSTLRIKSPFSCINLSLLYISFCFGSSASRRPSARRLKLSMSNARTISGERII